MEFSPVLNFFIGLISAIGYYRLFFTINRPAVRWRFIVMLVVVLLGRPLCLVWQLRYMENTQGINLFLTLVNFLIDSVSLIACVLLGPHRRRALVASVFILYLLYSSTEIFVGFFIVGFVYPLFSLDNSVQIAFAIPQVYYSGIFLFNLIVMGYCFLATQWFRKIRENPPVKACFFLCLFFLSFVIIIPIWQYYAITQLPPSSFFYSALLGLLLMIIPLFALYFFSRLAPDTKVIPANKKESENMAHSAKAGYAAFIGQLSKREQEVILAVLAGSIRYKTLASSLNISVNTVKTHLQHIYQITGVKNIEALSALFSGYSPAFPEITPKSP